MCTIDAVVDLEKRGDLAQLMAGDFMDLTFFNCVVPGYPGAPPSCSIDFQAPSDGSGPGGPHYVFDGGVEANFKFAQNTVLMPGQERVLANLTVLKQYTALFFSAATFYFSSGAPNPLAAAPFATDSNAVASFNGDTLTLSNSADFFLSNAIISGIPFSEYKLITFKCNAANSGADPHFRRWKQALCYTL